MWYGEERAYIHPDVDLPELSKIKRRIVEPVVEEPTVFSVGETEVKIDYDRGAIILLQDGEEIMATPIAERLLQSHREKFMDQSDVQEYLDNCPKPVGYRCACHYTKSNTKAAMRCTICGTFTNTPFYEGED